jgi:hypothetical protein
MFKSKSVNKDFLLVYLVTLVILVGLPTAVYSPGLSGDYVFDDFPNILKNQRLVISSLDIDELKTASLSSKAGLLQRPVSMLSFALNKFFWGNDPYSFKVVNLSIHVLNGLGIFFLTNLLISLYRKNSGFPHSIQNVRLFSLFVALVWLVHPINLTSVLYIVQRMTSLSAFFSILALIYYCYERNKIYVTGKAHWRLFLGCGFLVLLSILSKENGALTPLIMLCIEVLLFQFKSSKIQNTQSRVIQTDKWIIAFFLICLALPAAIGIGLISQDPERFFGGYLIREFNIYERILTQFRVIVFYLQMIVAPNIRELGLFHDDFELSRGLFNPATTFFAILLITGIIGITLKQFAVRKSLIAFGLLWFFIWHSLESTVLPLEMVHEHRNYLASYGVILSVFVLITEGMSRYMSSKPGFWLAVLVVLLLSHVTYLRAMQWQDNITHPIWEAEHHPRSTRANFVAGRISANLAMQNVPGWKERAFMYLDKASELSNQPLPDITLIMVASMLEEDVREEWIFKAGDKLKSAVPAHDTKDALKRLVECQTKDKCNLNKEQMVYLFQSALDNARVELLNGMKADMLTIYGEYLINNHGELNEGGLLFQSAIELAPNELQYQINMMNLLLLTGQYQKAEEMLRKAKELDHRGLFRKKLYSLQIDLDNRK